ncbi:YdiY family protein [Candidatus Omnitrophota bacterium]
MKKYFYFVYPILLFSYLFLLFPKILFAGEIYLKNGDKVSGKIIEESKDSVVIETEALGVLSIDRKFTRQVITDKEITEARLKKEENKIWQRESSLGYNKSSGNTDDSQLLASFRANRKTDHDEFTTKGDFLYSSSNREMDAQKWFGMARYAFSFGERKWYNFYKLESDHDRFANVDYRIIPSVGMGYWFSDEDDWKAMAELGSGLEYTNFRDETDDTDEMVLIPRVFFEKRMFNKSRIKEDIYLYPSLGDTGEFRLHSETVFENPIDDRLSLRFSLVDDYNSDPAKNSKKNDVRFISSLAYSF